MQTDKVVDCCSDAVSHFVINTELGQDGRVVDKIPNVEGIPPYCMIVETKRMSPLMVEIPKRYYVFFKREPFRSFGQTYRLVSKNKPYQTILGQTISLSALQRAFNDNADIVIVMADKTIRRISAEKFWHYVEEHRTVRPASNSYPGEQEASIPMSIMEQIR